MITTLDPSWRDWIVTNIRRNCTLESIVAAMVDKDFDPAFAKAIVATLAADSHTGDGVATLAAEGPAATAHPPAQKDESSSPANGPGQERYLAEPSRLPTSNTFVTSDRAVQVLARVTQPEVIVFANVLSEDECDELIRRSREKLARSTTVDPATGEAKVIERRTSSGTYFHLNADDFIASIDRRVSELLRWPANQSEGLQILRYEVGGEYRPHFDFFPPDDPGSRQHMSHGGQRIGTLIMYLNDVEDGGETIFPEISLSVMPRRGQAVYFGYCNSRNQVDPRTLHGGAPVRSGEKWIATRWLRQYNRT